MSEKIFARGLYVKRRENAPDFVVCNLGIALEQFIGWAKENVNEAGYVNIDVKKSKGGELYAELDTWKPDGNRTSVPPLPPARPETPDDFEEVPF